MKQKLWYVLALAAMVGLSSGCGTAEEPAKLQKEPVSGTEVTGAKSFDVVTVTPLPTATTAPTPTPEAKSYMEEKGIPVYGTGRHRYLGTVQHWNQEEEVYIIEHQVCESIFEVTEEDNGDGTKTIRAAVNNVPYIFEDGGYSSFFLCGFVDLHTGQTFFPNRDNYNHITFLRREDKNFKLTVSYDYRFPSVTYPYHSFFFTVICPSDYEDAGFYLTGTTGENVDWVRRGGNWIMLDELKNDNTEKLIFSVEEGLATIPVSEATKELVDGEQQAMESYFEKNGLATRGEGEFTYLGTIGTWDENGEIQGIRLEEQSGAFSVTEEPYEDGKKVIQATFEFTPKFTLDGAGDWTTWYLGFVDQQTGMSYVPFTYGMAEEYTIQQGSKKITLTMATEGKDTTLTDGKLVWIFTVVCPEDYNDAVFYISGNYKSEEMDEKRPGNLMPIAEVDHGESDMLFFK